METASGGRVTLLGSVHYLRETDYPLPETIERLYREADLVVLEIDLDDLDPVLLQQSFIRAATLPPDTRLSHVLSEEVYALTVEVARNMDVDLDLLSRLEPWLVANTLLDLGMMRSGFSPERGLEQYLLRRAAQDGIRIEGLESVEDQIAIFDSLETEAQEAMLAQTLAEIDTADVSLGEMIDAWRDGNLESLAESLVEDFAEFPGLYERLVVDRNRNWVDQIVGFGQAGENVLIVVGALHLTGEDSVIGMLIDEGLAIEPL